MRHSPLPGHARDEVLVEAHGRGWVRQMDYHGIVDPVVGLICCVHLDGDHAPPVVKGSEVSRHTLAALLNQLAGVPLDAMECGR